jgi:hypothetical protein
MGARIFLAGALEGAVSGLGDGEELAGSVAHLPARIAGA